MEKQNNVPKLRFPEFSDGWEVKKVGELCDSIVPGRNKPTEFNGEIPWITTPDIEHNGVIKFSKKGLNISRDEAKKVGSKIVPINSIIISCVGDLGLSAITGKEIVINQQLHAFLPKEKIQNRFLLYQLNLQKKYMDKVATKTAVPYMNKDNCNSIPISFPTLPEQQKIATFLSTVDEKLQALKQKKSLLEIYKKGVMQRLFSQVIRFKDDEGNDFEDWEMKKFSDYIKLYRGSSPRPINMYITKSESGVNWIKIGDMKSVENFVIEQVSEKITIEGALHSRKVEIGELILANSMSFGKTYQLNISGCIYDGWFVLREYEINYEKSFLLQLLNSEYLQKQYKTLSTGGVVQNISSEIVYSTNLLKPCLPEQTKIANFLTAIDEKINTVNLQIKQTELWKKGLLQGMFV